MNRRQFLKTNGALAAGTLALPTIIPSSALGLDGAVAPSNRITVGLIGAGDRGMHVIKNEFIPNKNAEVIAACDAFKRRVAGAVKTIDEAYGTKGMRGACRLP